jgi:hypothetical protein
MQNINFPYINTVHGALVFGAGTVQWSWGLDEYHDRTPTVANQDMQQATVNLLSDMGVVPATRQVNLAAPFLPLISRLRW